MATIDMNSIVQSTAKIKALNDVLASTTDPSAKAYIQSQIAVETAAMTANAQHMQSQADASANILDGLGLFATLSSLVGNQAPSLIALFRK